MRGAGKTYIGRIAAEVLGGEYTDADEVFAEHTQMSVSQLVEAKGWGEFRRIETELLKGFVQEKKGNHVIALGGGIVETKEARQVLQDHVAKGGNVVHVTRELESIEGFLNNIGNTAVRPNWGESFADVYKRRAPWYRECSSYEFYNTLEPLQGQTQEDHHRAMKAECRRFFRFISGIALNRPRLSADSPTSFLSLTFPDLRPALVNIAELTEGTDAVELRVDLLSPTGSAPTQPVLPPAGYVAKQLSMLRLATDLPIVFSVRSKDQGGFAPSDTPEEYFQLVRLGLRSACEFVDLEMAWPTSILETAAAEKRHSHVLASWHDWSGKMKWDGAEVVDTYRLCDKYGDVVKIVGMAQSPADNAALTIFASEHAEKPLLAINMGATGQLSRVNNPILTPVTHFLMPSRAAPGQLTVREIHQARNLIGLLPSKRFCLFGSPIAQSVSPTLHNTGFETLGLPYLYDRHESTEADQAVLDVISSPDFGGASVTIPLKLKIMPHLDTISEHAEVIGAVNTIIPRKVDGRRELHGDNTDWQAIRQAASNNLGSTSEGLVALVIGAGGTCRAAIYAMHQLGATSILLFNRTAENAAKVKDSFPRSYNIEIITSLSALPASPQVIISTVPGNSLTTTVGSEGIYLDPKVFKSPNGVAIELAYKPHMTALMQVAKSSGWKAVSGVEILCLQGFKQFELWTGKRAPEGKIRRAVMEAYLNN